MTALTLASRSASRRTMLEAAGVPFTSMAANIDERGLEATMADAPAPDVAIALAKAKASAVRSPDGIVLGSDSLVSVEGRRFDKPDDREQAAEHLRFFSGKVMELHSAAALQKDGTIVWSYGDVAKLHVRELGETFIARYLDAEWPEVGQCVGVFRMEGRGVQLFERIEGDYFTVLGMPLVPVLSALRRHDVIPA